MQNHPDRDEKGCSRGYAFIIFKCELEQELDCEHTFDYEHTFDREHTLDRECALDRERSCKDERSITEATRITHTAERLPREPSKMSRRSHF